MAPDALSKPQGSIVPKACESCRTRKIRCNRVIPCSNCLSSGITCRPARAAEHRPRILVSNNYEKQIELISERLGSIEQSLRGLTLPKIKGSPHSQDEQIQTTRDATPAPMQYEGLTSFQQQSMQATELATIFGDNKTQDVTSAIESLRDLISAPPQSPSVNQQLYFTENNAKQSDFELLPSGFVLHVLKRLRETQPIALMIVGIRDPAALERICQLAYFPMEPLPIGELTAMFGMLYFLIQEFVMFEDPIMKEYDADELMDMCKKGVQHGIQDYEVLTAPSYWNTVCLMIGATLATDDRRTLLAFTLINAASRHIVALGYHREASFKLDDPEIADRKRWLFWVVYSMDKTLALTLGRASCLPDYDIDTKFFIVSPKPYQHAWDATTLMFTKIAKIQGQIFELLYSSSGLQKPSSERALIIERLASELTGYQEDLRNIDITGAKARNMLKMLIGPSEVIYYSLLTIIYRASSHTEHGAVVSSQCFASARKALEIHLESFPLFSESATPDAMIGAYVNWILLYCSFTPFVVVFLHATASQSTEEIELLEKVTASLEKTRFLADDIERLYQTCLVFCRVARTIVESRQNLAGTYNEESNSFAFPDLSTTHHHHAAYGYNQLPDYFAQEGGMLPTSDDIGEMSTFFGTWMGGNQPVMDLLNMDISADLE